MTFLLYPFSFLVIGLSADYAFESFRKEFQECLIQTKKDFWATHSGWDFLYPASSDDADLIPMDSIDRLFKSLSSEEIQDVAHNYAAIIATGKQKCDSYRDKIEKLIDELVAFNQAALTPGIDDQTYNKVTRDRLEAIEPSLFKELYLVLTYKHCRYTEGNSMDFCYKSIRSINKDLSEELLRIFSRIELFLGEGSSNQTEKINEVGIMLGRLDRLKMDKESEQYRLPRADKDDSVEYVITGFGLLFLIAGLSVFLGRGS